VNRARTAWVPRPRAYNYVRRIVWKYRKRGTNYPRYSDPLTRGSGVKSMKPRKTRRTEPERNRRICDLQLDLNGRDRK